MNYPIYPRYSFFEINFLHSPANITETTQRTQRFFLNKLSALCAFFVPFVAFLQRPEMKK
jgi:hypothetical protein